MVPVAPNDSSGDVIRIVYWRTTGAQVWLGSQLPTPASLTTNNHDLSVTYSQNHLKGEFIYLHFYLYIKYSVFCIQYFTCIKYSV